MARYDKYDPISGGYRALTGEVFGPGIWGVRLDAAGAIIKSGGTGGADGIYCNPGPADVPAGEAVDVMLRGQVVELTGLLAGTDYYVAIGGAGLTATTTANVFVGTTVEADRLIVRM